MGVSRFSGGCARLMSGGLVGGGGSSGRDSGDVLIARENSIPVEIPNVVGKGHSCVI